MGSRETGKALKEIEAELRRAGRPFKDVARAAGVSFAEFMRLLNHDSHTAGGTAQRVRKALRRIIREREVERERRRACANGSKTLEAVRAWECAAVRKRLKATPQLAGATLPAHQNANGRETSGGG